MHILHLSDVIGWFAMNKVFLFLFFSELQFKNGCLFFCNWMGFFFFFTLFELSMICYAYCWHIEVNAFPTVITDLILLIFNTTLVVCLVFLFRKHKYIFLQIKYCLFYLLLYYYISRVYTKKKHFGKRIVRTSRALPETPELWRRAAAVATEFRQAEGAKWRTKILRLMENLFSRSELPIWKRLWSKETSQKADKRTHLSSDSKG